MAITVAAAGLAVAITSLVATVANSVTTNIREDIKEDKEERETFTKRFVEQASQQYPDYNIVIVHPEHRVSGNEVIHQHEEVQMHVGTIGYEIYFSKKGEPFEFELEGDGGFMNWAYMGDFTREGNVLRA